MILRNLWTALAPLALTFAASVHANTHSTQPVTDISLFADMDAQIGNMWLERDNLSAAMTQAGLIEDDHDEHELHDHHNEHGVGNGNNEDDIDVLISDDLLADKITELTDANEQDSLFGLTKDLVVEKPTVQMPPLALKPVANATVTSKYGYRRIFGKSQFHKGIDLAAKYGSPIYATGAGKVVYAGWMRGYGRFVEIDHQDGYKTRYAHNARLRVRVGDFVEANQRIADLGCSGRCTGPHLHYEVKKHGKHVNPNQFLAIAPSR